MKKKATSVLLTAAMVTGMLSGTAVTVKAEKEAAKTDEKMTISVMGIDWGFGVEPNSQMEQHWEEKLGVDMDIEWVSYQDYDQKLNTLIAANSQPDVVQINKINGSYYYPVLTQAIDAGQFVDLSKYLFNDGKGIAETNAVMKNWDEAFWNQAKYNDGIYILPRSKAESGQNSGIEVYK